MSSRLIKGDLCRNLRNLLSITDCQASATTCSTRKCSSQSSERTTHFGFEIVTEDVKSKKVKSVFSSVASKYDTMNDVMSLGVHRLWKDKFISALNPRPGMKLIDVAGGTGDIARRFLQYTETIQSKNQDSSYNFPDPLVEEDLQNNNTEKHAHVTVCDINQDMLEAGKSRDINKEFNQCISWVCGDAEKLPFDNNSFDAYTIAFGIRNTINYDKVLSEAYRVLKPGGRFLCLEFSQVINIPLRYIYDTYSFEVIPVLGQIIARDWDSYQYLVESIRKFPTQEEFKALIKEAGFRMVSYENLTSGIVAIHSGFKL